MVAAAEAHSDPGLDPGDVGAAFEVSRAQDYLGAAPDVRGEVDALIEECRNQARHNAPVSPGIVKQLEAIRAKLG